jgi:malonate-semialdehyde dehydrogenase (acetylating)/methylmalonate-semialdehyde dehydrogenase
MTLLEEPIKGVLRLENYIGGEWVEPETGEYREVVNPATMKTIAATPVSGEGDVKRAVEAAAEAFKDWRRTPPLRRARYLFRLKELLEEHFEEISRICTMEHGKIIREARGEVRRGIENVEVATGIPSLMMGYNLEDIAEGIDEFVIRQPVGVFACIAPFNFPFMIPLWFMPYAVATGNTYIIKPSPWAPICQSRLLELIEEAGFPPGVVNLVHGDVEAAQALLRHPDVKGISFVGSTKVGRIIYREGAAQGKRVQAQCSAKNFVVVMPDAVVDEPMIRSIMGSFFGNTGQRCLSGANLLVVGGDDFYEKLMRRVVEATEGLTIGYGLDEEIDMGPLQAEFRKRRVLGYIEKGLEEGARLLLDGREFKILGGYPENCFLGPSIFVDATPEMTIAREEIFGPVMSVLRAESLDEAIEMVNSSSYGNAASIFTTTGKAARKFQYEVKCGNIGINIGVVAPMAFFPFSGMKDSFFGDLHGQGRDAINFYTERKVVIVRWF